MHLNLRPKGRLLAVAMLSASLVALPYAHADEAPAPTPTGYHLDLLHPSQGHVAAAGLALSDEGDFVGITRPTDKAQPQLGALWHEGEKHPHELDQLEGSQFSRPMAVGADGTVVGEAFDKDGNSIPVAWNGEAISALPSPNANGRGVAWAISGRNILATAHDGTRTVSYLTDGKTVNVLPEPKAKEGPTKGYSIKSMSPNGSWAAGIATIAVPHGDHSHDERYLAVWHDDHWHTYPTDTSLRVNPKGVNDSAAIVGDITRDGVTSAARLARGEAVELANPQVEGFPHTTANAINNAGVTVGAATKMAGNYTFGGAALVWFGDEVRDLNTLVDLPLGVTLQSAADVNEKGQIIGTASTPDGQVAFLLTPEGDGDPSPVPTDDPTDEPSEEPSEDPTQAPTPKPTEDPTHDPKPTPDPEPTTSAPGKRPGLPKTGK